MTAYTVESVKTPVETARNLAAALEMARAIDAEYRPAFGVTVSDADGATLLTVDGAEVETGSALDSRLESLAAAAGAAGDNLQVAMVRRVLGEDYSSIALRADERARVDAMSREQALAKCLDVVGEDEESEPEELSADYYQDGSLIVAVEVRTPHEDTRLGLGETPREAYSALTGTPISSAGRDAGATTLRWASNDGRITSADLERISVTADDLDDRSSAWD